MAFRFGHQITCNINKNIFNRSSSADSSRRCKTLSPICLNRHINENQCTLCWDKRTNISRARSLPSSEDNISVLPCRRFYSSKQFGAEFEARGSENDSFTSNECSPPKKILTVKFETKISNTNLQPSNLTPIACTYIHHTPSPQPKSLRHIKIDNLKRSASMQYEQAIKASNQHSDDGSCRYQLESAKPKPENDSIVNVRAFYQKKYQTVTAKAPQLQPKNIKPYGNINTLPWCAPNVEYSKKGTVIQDENRSKYETLAKTSTVNEPEKEVVRPTAKHAQQRDYSTLNKNTQPNNMSIELEQCKAIISEYKKVNPEYVEKKFKLIPGSEEEKKFIEHAEKFVANVKNKQENDKHVKLNVESVNDLSSSIPIEQNSKEKEDINEVTNNSSKFLPKINLQQPGQGQIILYYDEKNGNKTLCSKVIKQETSVDVDNNNLPSTTFSHYENESKPIKLKIGPKTMLQSTNLKDSSQYSAEELTPAANEKFIAPWLSWGDRVKRQTKVDDKLGHAAVQSTSLQEPCLKKSNTILAANIAKDSSVRKHPEIQKREFSIGSQSSTLFQPDEAYFNWTEMWNKCNGGLRADDILFKRDYDKNTLFSPVTNRCFSTNSTRGVLGPEGTVMVKLRRLPKVNIPEPSKDCPEPPSRICARADGTINVKQKKLPKLGLVQCDPPPKAKMKDKTPLARLRSRGEPPDPPRICPEVEKCSQGERADKSFRIAPKKLPKIIPSCCFPCPEQKMTTPPLPRLKARPIPPPPPCEDVIELTCPPRADEGLKVTRKKLPDLKMSGCCPICKPEMNQGEPLRRLKKAYVPDPQRSCIDISEGCPPRSDEVLGYTVKRKKLQTLILSEKYNNVSSEEFNSKLNKPRHYTTDSKYNMCCYSNKNVHPDIKLKNESVPSMWDKFDGRLISEADGKMKAYLPLKETIDMSTGTELKIIKKPVGSSYQKDEHFHEELLKSGFTTFNNNYRKFSSLTAVLCKEDSNTCNLRPEKIILKDLRLKPLRKRKGFEKDFPARLRFQEEERKKECCPKCTIPRMDDLMRYEVKAKSLPVLPKGRCERKEKPIPKTGPSPIRRLKKNLNYTEYECPKLCIEVCPPRADDNLIETPKKLPPMVMSKCPKPVRKHSSNDDNVFKRLPKFKLEDQPRCKPAVRSSECDIASRSDVGKDLYELRNLPKLIPSNCPPKPHRKLNTSFKIPRLPKPPFYDREDDCRSYCEKATEYRSDVLNNYQVKMKKLKVILKSSNKSFSTLPNNFYYDENVPNFRLNRRISMSRHLLLSDKKECKKLVKTDDKKKKVCSKFQIEKCKPATSISCKTLCPKQVPCTKQKSPYPAFSECKDNTTSEIITECQESDRHLQPRWPILNEIINQKAPPPYQDKIDPTKEEECIAKKLNFKMEGETKTCDTFHKPYKPAVTKEMYDDVMKNPPYDECECANEAEKMPESKEKGPCKPVNQSVCQTPEIECALETEPIEDLSCIKSKKNKEPSGKKGEGSSDAQKLICKKKSDAESEKKSECSEIKAATKKVEQVEKPKVLDKSDICEEIDQKAEQKHKEKDKKERMQKRDCKEEQKHERQSKCEEKQVIQCKPKSEEDCQKKKKECEDKKKENDKNKESMKEHCRNTKTCKKKGVSKKKVLKKCSDLLKEDEQTKKTEKKARSAEMADLCAYKPSSDKPKTKKRDAVPKTVSCPSVVPKCPPKKGLLQRILDFFRARPNCPEPDQWKKDKLRRKAEKAAAAAGYELCEKKKPTVVKVVCKKTGVKDNKPPNSKNKQDKGLGKGCKRSNSTYAANGRLQTVYHNSLSTFDKHYSSSSSGEKPNKCKIASVVKAKECPASNEDDCIQEESTEKESSGSGNRSGRQCKLPRQKYCKPPARQTCKVDKVKKTCTTVIPPYPSFSECKKRFPKLPISECSEQEKNVKRKSITYDYNDPIKSKRNYSTAVIPKRFYSSSSNGGRNYDILSFLHSSENSIKDLENEDLALRILAVIKECIKSVAMSNHCAKETYCNIFKQLELLCEEELNKTKKKEILSDPEKKCIKPYSSSVLHQCSLCYKKSLLDQTDFSNLDDTIITDPIQKFCKTIFSVPDHSTQSYEESERMKTEKLQKKLDEILDNYQTQ